MIEIIGVYLVPESEDVSLVEVLIQKNPDEFDISDFTQEIESIKTDNWQAPFGEFYLDTDGNLIIGDFFNIPKSTAGITRFTFFMYFLDTNKPLKTPMGDVVLPKKTTMPERLKGKVIFEDPE